MIHSPEKQLSASVVRQDSKVNTDTKGTGLDPYSHLGGPCGNPPVQVLVRETCGQVSWSPPVCYAGCNPQASADVVP